MTTDSYVALDPGGGIAMVRKESQERLKRIDSIVFDCDGTLIDARRSYDATIMRTVRTMVERFSRASLPMDVVGGGLILQIRRTGGFNSDWDSTYALSMLSEAAVEECRSEGSGSRERTLSILERLVRAFASKKRLEGPKSVDSYLSRAGLDSEHLDEFRKFLGFPGNPRESFMATTFDQIYYGGELFEEIYGFKPPVWHAKGLIERESLFITQEDIKRLERIIHGRKMAIATGRPFVAVRYTLGRLLRYFRRDASVFIGDGDIYPELTSELARYRKPSGASLIRAREKLSATAMLYIGDSAEDRLMVDDARRRFRGILFAGVCGSSFDEESQIRYFERTASDLLVSSVDQVPAVLEMIRR